MDFQGARGGGDVSLGVKLNLVFLSFALICKCIFFA